MITKSTIIFRSDLAALQGSEILSDRLAVLSNGDRYITSNTNNGYGVLLASGNYANKLEPTNNQTGTTYTLALTDYQGKVYMNNATANTAAVPEDSAVSLPVGFETLILMEGAGVTTVKASPGVTLNGIVEGGGVLAQYKGVAIEKRGANNWFATPLDIS